MIAETTEIEIPADLAADLAGAPPAAVEARLWAWIEQAYPAPTAEDLCQLAIDAARHGYNPELEEFRTNYLRDCVEGSRIARQTWDRERTLAAALRYIEAVAVCRYAVRDALAAWNAQGGEA